jgi:hypothetical protein
VTALVASALPEFVVAVFVVMIFASPCSLCSRR